MAPCSNLAALRVHIRAICKTSSLPGSTKSKVLLWIKEEIHSYMHSCIHCWAKKINKTQSPTGLGLNWSQWGPWYKYRVRACLYLNSWYIVHTHQASCKRGSHGAGMRWLIWSCLGVMGHGPSSLIKGLLFTGRIRNA